VFARERLAAEESAAEREAALERALGALLYLAEKAHCRFFGGDYVRIRSDAPRWPLPDRLAEQLVSDPLSWYDSERATLVAGVRQAAQAGLVELSWGLASSTVALFESRIYLDDWRETHDIALEATRKARHVRGRAAMLNSIGAFHLTQQRLEPARQELTEAAQLFEEAGDEQGMALVIRHLAYLDRLNGRLGDATRRYEHALAIFRRIGDQIATAYVLHGLAQVRLELNQPDGAKELLSEALLLCQVAQCGRIEAQVLHRLGEAHLLAGELVDAIGAFKLSLVMSNDIGDLVGEAYALQGIGVASVRQTEFVQARNALQSAVEFAVTAGERLAEARALLGLSELALASGDPNQAVVFGRQASEMFRGMGAMLYDARALALLSDVHIALGDVEAANAASAEAVALRTKLVGDAGLSREPLARQRSARLRLARRPTVPVEPRHAWWCGKGLQWGRTGSWQPSVLGQHVTQQSLRGGGPLAGAHGAGGGSQLGQQGGRLAVGQLGRARQSEQDPPKPGKHRGVTPVVRVNERQVQRGKIARHRGAWLGQGGASRAGAVSGTAGCQRAVRGAHRVVPPFGPVSAHS
jgi:tetratricopeptide (TPR) repeat protein